jgi:hypothetical protein
MQTYGLPDMHEVRSNVKSIAPKPEEILSPETLSKCQNAEFWRTLTNDLDDEIDLDDDFETSLENVSESSSVSNTGFLIGA